MITKKTAIKQIELTEHDTVQVQIALRIVEGEDILSQQYHRFSISPTDDFDTVINGVNQDITSRGYDAIDQDGKDRIWGILGTI